MRIKQISLEDTMKAIGSGEVFNPDKGYFIVATGSKKLIPVVSLPVSDLPGWAKGDDAAFIQVEYRFKQQEACNASEPTVK